MAKRRHSEDSSIESEPNTKALKREIFKQQRGSTMSIKINPPDIKCAKNYECFKTELLLWQSLTSLEASKQAGCIALNLPNDCLWAKDIRTKVMERLSIQELCADNGFSKLVSILDEELLQPEIEQAVEDWDNLENRVKNDGESIEEFVNDFERLLARVENKGAKLPACVKCFMMLKRIKLSHEERLIVLSKLDFEKKDNLFSDVKKCLKLLKGKTMAQAQSDQTIGEVYFSHREPGRGRGKGGFRRTEASRTGGGGGT